MKNINIQHSEALKRTLTLRWSPVALKMLRPDEAIPEGVYAPASTMRHCQSIIAARRGHSLYMSRQSHACPDGSGILGIVPMSDKLRSGDLYLLFKKLPNIEIAKKMISTRNEFKAGEYKATVIAPLEDAQFEPDIVIMTIQPEQAMWICCATTYSSGDRQVFHTSGYNSACTDLVVNVMKNDEMNISFGCYGARAASDVGDNELYLSIPYKKLPKIIEALEKLAEKSIPESRSRMYLPPVIGRTPMDENTSVGSAKIIINEESCDGCGICEAFCPESILVIEGEKARSIDDSKCYICNTCVGQCPQKAIRII